MLENFNIPDDPILDEGTPDTDEGFDLYEDLGTVSEYDDSPDWDPDDWN